MVLISAAQLNSNGLAHPGSHKLCSRGGGHAALTQERSDQLPAGCDTSQQDALGQAVEQLKDTVDIADLL
jgi:hypothetical protein